MRGWRFMNVIDALRNPSPTERRDARLITWWGLAACAAILLIWAVLTVLT